MPDARPMQIVGMYVLVTIPESMTPERACEEVKTSIGFGRPTVSLQYVLPGTTDG